MFNNDIFACLKFLRHVTLGEGHIDEPTRIQLLGALDSEATGTLKKNLLETMNKGAEDAKAKLTELLNKFQEDSKMPILDGDKFIVLKPTDSDKEIDAKLLPLMKSFEMIRTFERV